MRSFLLAVRFLTILPLPSGRKEGGSFSGALVCFPLVGLLLGLLLAGAYVLLKSVFPEAFCGLAIVVLLALATGGLHLDGLGDTFDGLGSRKDRDGMLAVMKDSHIGSMGVIAIVSVLLLKLYLIALLPAALTLKALVLMPALSRWSMLLPLYRFPYARAEGTGKVFAEHMHLDVFTGASLITLVLAAGLLKVPGIFAFVTAALVAFLFGKLMNRCVGGVTGDVLGAVNEMNEAAVLAALYLFKP
jgi:adenosylcobinamide-GDP ribazoletransferase